MHFVSAVTA